MLLRSCMLASGEGTNALRGFASSCVRGLLCGSHEEAHGEKKASRAKHNYLRVKPNDCQEAPLLHFYL